MLLTRSGALLGALLTLTLPAASRAQMQDQQITAKIAVKATAGIDIGTTVSEITVQDEKGAVTIDPAKTSATVVVFVSNRCPVSNSYNARMNSLYRDYNGKNVQFVFADANVTEREEDIKELGTPAKLGAIIYKDADNQLADKFGARVTPEVFVFDSKGALRYRGAIDDSQTEEQIKNNFARDALDQMLAGKDVAVTKSNAFGCSIKRKRVAS